MCRNFSCQVCVAHSLTHCWKSSRLDDPQVSFTCSMTEAAQTGQLKFLHMFSNKVTNKPNSQIAALTAIWQFERWQNESGHPLDLRSAVAFERVKDCHQVPQSGQQSRLGKLLATFYQPPAQADQRLTRGFGLRPFGARQPPDHQASRRHYQQSPRNRFGRRLLPLFDVMAGALKQFKVGLNFPAPKIPLRDGLRRDVVKIGPEHPACEHFALLVAQLTGHQSQLQRLAFDTLVDVLALLDPMTSRRPMQHDLGLAHVLASLFPFKLALAAEFKLERRADLR